ncbi:DUF6807 family protein [Sanguibacter suaedae]|uniref:PmoA family protein n=1 Tax=Sanguibacter suaedae TaxID=2795737 RepID=A0A934I7Y2_9MICO|nr:DUF6807 family protein [Sanguibacter suaedae]MBI9113870.1 PmoA family protein [Sanguibacter suaedae]
MTTSPGPGGPGDPADPGRTLTVALLGAGGHGRSHLRAVRELAASTVGTSAPPPVRLLAVADPAPPPGIEDELGPDAVFRTAQDLFAVHSPDLTIICTPINTHLELAELAFAAGSHVLLEKPPTPSLASFRRLLAAADASGLACQVGFQSLGSDALARLRTLVADGSLGKVTGIGAVGTWLRDDAYWSRARWAGRRTLDGAPVVDGVVTNPLAHAVATALAVDGSTRVDDVLDIDVDLFHANRIESDDTSSVRLRTRRGTTVALGLTLCASVQTAPRVVVHGTLGTATLYYTQDVLEVTHGTDAPTTERLGRTPLLANLVDHVRTGAPLLCPVEETGAFMRVLDAVRAAPDPREIPPEHLRTEIPEPWPADEPAPPGTPRTPHIVVADVAEWCERVAHELRTFTELGAPWTVEPPAREHEVLAVAHVAGRPVAEYVDGSGARPSDSPRPHLHPVRTLGGVVVTDSAPADHTWHVGVAPGVQDVDGHNLWGGRTYVRDHGYVWRDDHGRIEHDGWASRGDDGFVENLAWTGHDGVPLLRERRSVRWWRVRADAWALELRSALSVDPDRTDAVALGSPGSNGRTGGGYGGFFWRLPACTDVRVRTAAAEGEDDVHGTTAPWLAWSARTARGAFTLVAEPACDEAATDPWVVRVASYPGFGSAIAWDSPTVVTRGTPAVRAHRVAVADGYLSRDAAASLARAMARSRRDGPVR